MRMSKWNWFLCARYSCFLNRHAFKLWEIYVIVLFTGKMHINIIRPAWIQSHLFTLQLESDNMLCTVSKQNNKRSQLWRPIKVQLNNRALWSSPDYEYREVLSIYLLFSLHCIFHGIHQCFPLPFPFPLPSPLLLFHLHHFLHFGSRPCQKECVFVFMCICVFVCSFISLCETGLCLRKRLVAIRR